MNHPAVTQGRTAVITGGANGIGFAVAQRLLGQGMHVCIADRDEAQLQTALRLLGGDVSGEVVDVSDFGAVERFRDLVFQHCHCEYRIQTRHDQPAGRCSVQRE